MAARRSGKAIDAPLVARLVARQFPQWAGLAVNPVVPGGWDHRTFRLGAELAVRLPSARRYTVQVRREYEWLPRLAPHLPCPIPDPLALGEPDLGFAWNWSVVTWLPGIPVNVLGMPPERLAEQTADFMNRLQRIDPREGPRPGADNFHRGGALSVYATEMRAALDRLSEHPDRSKFETIWRQAIDAPAVGTPTWVHGDFAAGNLLVDEGGDLCGVIDWGAMAIGDPACDLVLAWTVLDARQRTVFLEHGGYDSAVARRAAGWALWKAATVVAGINPASADERVRQTSVLTALARDFG